MNGQTGAANNKGGASTSNTGQPAWASGSQGNIGAGATTAPQGGIAPAGGANNGAAPAPGTDAYNAMNAQLTTGPMQAINNILAGGGNSPQAQQILQNLMGTSGTNAGMNQAGQMYQSLSGNAGQPGANQQYLTDFANGNMMNSNPYLDAITNKAEQDAMTSTNQMFAAGGRYGSGSNQGAVSEAVANANNQFRGQEYENEANRRMTAANQISGEQTNRLGLQGQAAQGLGSLGTSGMQNWLTAQQNAGQLGSQGTQNMLNAMGQLGNVQSNKLFDANQQLGVGNQTTAQTQQQINDYMNQWTQGDMQDWARTGALLSSGTGAAGSWGTATGTQKDTTQPGIGSIIGGIMAMM
jgi:hypothetical protein